MRTKKALKLSERFTGSDPSVRRGPLQVDECESNSENHTTEDKKEELREFPTNRHSMARSGRQIKLSLRFDLCVEVIKYRVKIYSKPSKLLEKKIQFSTRMLCFLEYYY